MSDADSRSDSNVTSWLLHSTLVIQLSMASVWSDDNRRPLDRLQCNIWNMYIAYTSYDSKIHPAVVFFPFPIQTPLINLTVISSVEHTFEFEIIFNWQVNYNKIAAIGIEWAFLSSKNSVKALTGIQSIDANQQNHLLASTFSDPLPICWVKGCCSLYNVSLTPGPITAVSIK